MADGLFTTLILLKNKRPPAVAGSKGDDRAATQTADQWFIPGLTQIKYPDAQTGTMKVVPFHVYNDLIHIRPVIANTIQSILIPF